MMLKNKKGFTLVEILLVTVIAASLLMMFLGYVVETGQQTRRDRAVIQMQQIMNAALSFYTQNGRWPSTTGSTSTSSWIAVQAGHELVDQSYISNSTFNAISPYGTNYYTAWDTSNNMFYVVFALPQTPTSPNRYLSDATIIKSQLPFGRTAGRPSSIPGLSIPPTGAICTTSNAYCFVIANIPPPGQNLNNARSVNFAAVYHASACVPAPTCPTNMIPQIFVVPTSVSGVNDAPTGCTNNTTTGCSINVYPISSYTGYAVGYTSAPPSNPSNYAYIGAPYYLSTAVSTMPPCTSGGTPAVCYASNAATGGTTTPIAAPGYYWRVCLGIVTERGAVTPTALSGSQPSPWGLLQGTVMVMTRCVPGNITTGAVSEPVGSNFTVFNPSGN